MGPVKGAGKNAGRDPSLPSPGLRDQLAAEEQTVGEPRPAAAPESFGSCCSSAAPAAEAESSKWTCPYTPPESLPCHKGRPRVASPYSATSAASPLSHSAASAGEASLSGSQ